MTLKTYSTQQVAKLAGIHRTTLYRWMDDPVSRKVVYASTVFQNEGNQVVRRWSVEDLARLKNYVATHYMTTRPKGTK